MNNRFLSKVFKWFGIGLLITFLVAFLVSTNEKLLIAVFSGPTMLVIVLLELFCALWLSLRINKMQETTAKMLYIGYAALTGLTFSSIFVLYDLTSIIWIFLATSLIFILFSIIGKNIKVSLNNLGIFLFIALLSIIILEIINIFIMNNTIDLVLCIACLIVFIGYVAYDIQKISRLDTNNDNLAIIGAFNIYLDFINIFVRLLQLFGKRND